MLATLGFGLVPAVLVLTGFVLKDLVFFVFKDLVFKDLVLKSLVLAGLVRLLVFGMSLRVNAEQGDD